MRVVVINNNVNRNNDNKISFPQIIIRLGFIYKVEQRTAMRFCKIIP